MDHLLFQQTAFYQRELSLFKTRRDGMSEWRWYHDGGNNRWLGKWKGEPSRAAEWWRTEDLRRQEAKVICRETGRENRLFPKLLFHLFVSLGESQGDPRMPIQRRGKQPERFEGGVIEQRLWLRDETRGALASLRVSMVAAVVSPFSPDICRSFFSLFFCLRTVLSRRHGNRFPTPAPDILTYHASIIIDVRSVSCWCLKPQIEFTTDHSSKVITPFKGAKSQTFRPFPHVYHPVSQCWIVKRKKDGLSRKRECSPHITVLCI